MKAPHNNTETSMDAASSIETVLGKMQTDVLNFVRSSQEGATCDEIEAALGYKHQTASARLNDLTKLGLVCFKYDAAGKAFRRLTRSGRGARVYFPRP